MRPYIGDGYNQTFFIRGEDGLYPPCRFSGRRMGHHQAAGVMREANAEPNKADEIYAAAIAERLTGWSYQADSGQWRKFDDDGGAPINIAPQTVGGLVYNLFCRLRDIILGIAASDDDPDNGGKQPPTPEADAKN